MCGAMCGANRGLGSSASMRRQCARNVRVTDRADNALAMCRHCAGFSSANRQCAGHFDVSGNVRGTLKIITSRKCI